MSATITHRGMTDEEVKTFVAKVEKFELELTPKERVVLRDALEDEHIVIRIPGKEDELDWYG